MANYAPTLLLVALNSILIVLRALRRVPVSWIFGVWGKAREVGGVRLSISLKGGLEIHVGIAASVCGRVGAGCVF